MSTAAEVMVETKTAEMPKQGPDSVRIVLAVDMMGRTRVIPSSFDEFKDLFNGCIDAINHKTIKFGFRPGIDLVIHAVSLVRFNWCTSEDDLTLKLKSCIESFSPHLIVIGNTPPMEKAVSLICREKDRNLCTLIARFSGFYPDASEYTEKTPQESGYDLDIFKDLKLIELLINSCEFLGGLHEQDSGKVRNAIEVINQKPQVVHHPILILSDF